MSSAAAASLYDTWMTQQDDAWVALGPLTDADFTMIDRIESTGGRNDAGTDVAAPAVDLPACVSATAVLQTVDGLAPSVWPPDAVIGLRRIDTDRLSRVQLVDYVHAKEREKAHLEGLQVRALAVLDHQDDSGFQAVREDVACALQIAPAAAQTRLKSARALVDDLPVTLAALDAGGITARHAQVMCEVAWRVDGATARRVEAAIVGDCEFTTPTMLARAARAAVMRLDPDGADRRHHRAAADRSVEVAPADDGMAYLNVYGPAVAVATVFNRVDAAARLLPTADSRTRAQQRFDMLVDGLLSGIPAGGLAAAQGRAPQIQVTVSASTLLGLDDAPAELSGYGAITAQSARQIAHDPTGTWRRIVLDPVVGQVVEYGRTTYRPPQALVDVVSVRDKTCVFPGCRQPARRCDIDHVQPWDRAGTTGVSNLAVLCRRHHRLKTSRRWSYRLRSDGAITWLSSTGRRYRSRRPSADRMADPPAASDRAVAQLPAADSIVAGSGALFAEPAGRYPDRDDDAHGPRGTGRYPDRDDVHSER